MLGEAEHTAPAWDANRIKQTGASPMADCKQDIFQDQIPQEIKRLVRTGVYLFPVRRREKFPPLFRNPHALATNTPKRIGEWHREFNGPNWAVSIDRSGLFVLDVDAPGVHKDDGFATLLDLELSHSQLPATFTVETPNGGKHFYFKQTNVVRYRKKIIAPGVESPAYAIAPGCKLASGAYRIVQDAPIALAPDWLADYLDANADAPDVSQVPLVELDQPVNVDWAISYLRDAAPPSIQGEHGEYRLLCVAGVLKDHGISAWKATDLLLTHYNPRCDPPWDYGDDAADGDDLEKKVKNAWQYLRQNRPGSLTAEAEFAGTEDTEVELLAFRALWQEHDRKQSFTVIDGMRFPVVRPTPNKKNKKRGVR
jgi:hypothetical protein